MEIKIGEKYELKQDQAYFCIPIQRKVKFTSQVCVEVVCKSRIRYFDQVKKSDFIFFGKLIVNSASGPDYVSENEIEFHEEDVVGTYTMKTMPLFYMDFVGIREDLEKNEEV